VNSKLGLPLRSGEKGPQIVVIIIGVFTGKMFEDNYEEINRLDCLPG